MRPKFILCLIIIHLSLFTFFVFAQEEPIRLKEVIVTASRIEESPEEVASATTVITSEELKQKGITTIVDALREVPGVQVMQSGAFGGVSSIFVRGGNYGQALVMIDGVPVYEAMGVYKGDFGAFLPHLPIEQIERIEIVRGPQSVLYGSNAMTGVINIITKKGKGKPKIRVFSEGGSYSTFREGGEFLGETEHLRYNFNYTRSDSSGISKATGYPEKDGHRFHNFSSNVEGKIGKAKIGTSVNYNSASTDLDYYWDTDTFTIIADASGYKEERDLISVKSYFEHEILPSWRQKFIFSYTNTDRDYIKDGIKKDGYDGRLYYLTWQNNFEFEPFVFISGIDYQRETVAEGSGIEGRDFDQISWFGEGIFKWKGLYFSGGVRYYHHETAGDKVTCRIASAYTFPTKTKIHASYGTGFRAPSLYQVYGEFSGMKVGNSDLRPEKSEGYDVGITQTLSNGKIEADITYFFNWFDNLIIYCYPDGMWWLGKYQNIATAHTEGVEFSLNITPVSWLKFLANYAWLDAIDTTNNTWLPRRSKHKGSGTLVFLWKDKADFSLGGTYFGKRFDSENNENPLSGYFVVNLAARCYPTSYLTLNLCFQNLFDREYEEVMNYTGLPFMAFLGAEFKW